MDSQLYNLFTLSYFNMEQLIAHLIGDYIFQSHWMALNKVKNSLIGYFACFIHCFLYSIPFLFIGSPIAVFVIFVTHYFIDKFRLARYIGMIKNWNFNTSDGFDEDVPKFLSVWLIIIIDNTLHLTINYFALKYL